jgi:hypothetical protein
MKRSLVIAAVALVLTIVAFIVRAVADVSTLSVTGAILNALPYYPLIVMFGAAAFACIAYLERSPGDEPATDAQGPRRRTGEIS